MLRRLLLSLVLPLLVFFTAAGQSPIIDMTRANPLQNIGRATTRFVDSSASLSLREVQGLQKEGKFTPGTSGILNLGNTAFATWIHLSLKQSGNTPSYLIIGSVNIEEIDCYTGVDGQWQHFKAGSLIRPSPGVRSTNQFIFPVNVPGTAEVSEIWLRVKSRNILLLPLQVARADNLSLNENSVNRIIELCFIGFLAALFIFHLFLYISVKDVAYLYYCLYILSLGIYTVGYLSGHIYLLGDAARRFVYSYPHIFFCIGFGTSILITNRFYNIRSISVRLFRWTNILLGSLVILMIVSALGFKALSALGAQFFGLVVPLTLIVTSLYAYKAERKAIHYLVAAWLFFVIAVIYYVLCLQGILVYRSYSPVLLQTGVLVEFMLLAMALGQRYQSILQKQRRVEAENFKLIQTHNTELEQQVARRTQNLNDAISKLKASDEVKNRLFSIIAHDLRTPFNSILTLLSGNTIDHLSEEELKLVLRSSSSQFQQLKIMLDNILHWARSEMKNVHLVREQFDLKQILSSFVTIYTPIAAAGDIRLMMKIPEEPVLVSADRHHIQLVLRNLLDNAVKYSNRSSDIEIKLHTADNMVLVGIKNSFTGAGKAVNGQQGTGLGISLCEDYLQRNGSALQTEVAGNIIQFRFELPVV